MGNHSTKELVAAVVARPSKYKAIERLNDALSAADDAAADGSGRAFFVGAGAANAMAAALLCPEGSPAGWALAALALDKLADKPELRPQLAEAGAIEALVAMAMREDPSLWLPDIALRIAWPGWAHAVAWTWAGRSLAPKALGKLAHEPTLRARLAEAGAIEAMVAVASRDEGGWIVSKPFRGAACCCAAYTLAALAREATLRPRLAEAGAIEAMVAVATREGSTSTERTNAADILAELGTEATLRPRLAEAGAIEAMVTLATREDADCIEREHAAWLLCGLAQSAALRGRLAEAGAIEALVAVAGRHLDRIEGTEGEPEMRGAAAAALTALAEDASLRARLAEAGAIEPMVAIATRWASTPEGRTCAGGVLRKLAEEASLRSRLVKAGTARALRAALATWEHDELRDGEDAAERAEKVARYRRFIADLEVRAPEAGAAGAAAGAGAAGAARATATATGTGTPACATSAATAKGGAAESSAVRTPAGGAGSGDGTAGKAKDKADARDVVVTLEAGGGDPASSSPSEPAHPGSAITPAPGHPCASEGGRTCSVHAAAATRQQLEELLAVARARIEAVAGEGGGDAADVAELATQMARLEALVSEGQAAVSGEALLAVGMLARLLQETGGLEPDAADLAGRLLLLSSSVDATSTDVDRLGG